MDQSSESCRYDDRQRTTTKSQLREILDDLHRQDRALLRVSSDLLDTIAALKEAHESLKNRSWTSSVARGDDAQTVRTENEATGTASIEGGSKGLWTCTTEKSS